MSIAARAEANRAQRAAADPAVSAFVAASAGSGKTKLLTDRLYDDLERYLRPGLDPDSAYDAALTEKPKE